MLMRTARIEGAHAPPGLNVQIVPSTYHNVGHCIEIIWNKRWFLTSIIYLRRRHASHSAVLGRGFWFSHGTNSCLAYRVVVPAPDRKQRYLSHTNRACGLYVCIPTIQYLLQVWGNIFFLISKTRPVFSLFLSITLVFYEILTMLI